MVTLRIITSSGTLVLQFFLSVLSLVLTPRIKPNKATSPVGGIRLLAPTFPSTQSLRSVFDSLDYLVDSTCVPFDLRGGVLVLSSVPRI